MLKNILWDLDGTIFDSYPAISSAFDAAFRTFGVILPIQQITALALVSFRHCYTTVAQTHQLDVDAVRARFTEAYRALDLSQQRPFPGVEEALKLPLARGGKNGIVTHRELSTTLGLLDIHHLRGYFAGWVTADDGFPRKPAPDAFQAAVERLGLIPGETLGIGDRDLDLQSAQGAGLRTCAFGSGLFTVQADAHVLNFAQLIDWWNKL